MAYGTANVDVIQSSTANVPVQFKDGNGTQVGTLCRAWVNFNGTSATPITPRANFNVGSVTKVSTGQYTLNFITALPDTSYATVGMCGNNSSATAWVVGPLIAQTTSAFTFFTLNGSQGYADFPNVCIAVFR